MATCKFCTKKGLFLSVSKNGLCQYCELKFQTNLSNNIRRINDCERIIENSKNGKVIGERLAFLIELISEFTIFEDRDITVFTHPIDKLVEDKACGGNEVLLNIIQAKYLVTKEKIGTIKTDRAKTNLFDKFVSDAIDYKGYFSKSGSNYNSCIESIDGWIKELS